MATGPRIVTAEEIARILEGHLGDYIDCVRETFKQYSSGATVNPLRTWVQTDAESGLICMPAFVASNNVLAVKLLTFGPGRFGGNVALFDPVNHSLCALMEAESITEYRTAAMSVAATMIMAPGARRLGVYGAGVQARRHIHMLARLLPIEEIFIWNHREERGKRLVNELSRFGFPVRWCQEPRDAAQELIVTATNSKVPVLKRDWLPPRCHINCVGAPQKDQQELDAEIMKNANLVMVDSKESALNESGDVILSGVDVTEIGAVLMSGVNLTKSNSLTVFKSLGIAVQDAATASFHGAFSSR